MQDVLASWAVSVTVAVIFSAIISSLLPESGIKKYVAVVLGVVVTIFMLSPLFRLFEGASFDKEIKNALDGLSDTSRYNYDSSLYRDYIFKVYMSDE